jgi:hypothetical protein
MRGPTRSASFGSHVATGIVIHQMVHHAYQKLSPKEAQELGQKYYRVRQYDLALEAFSAVRPTA